VPTKGTSNTTDKSDGAGEVRRFGVQLHRDVPDGAAHTLRLCEDDFERRRVVDATPTRGRHAGIIRCPGFRRVAAAPAAGLAAARGRLSRGPSSIHVLSVLDEHEMRFERRAVQSSHRMIISVSAAGTSKGGGNR
jgi:hypothetical protein